MLDQDNRVPKNKYQRRLWLILERPNSSLIGRIIAFFSVVIVVLSVLIMCLETVVDSKSHERQLSLKIKPKINLTPTDYNYEESLLTPGERRTEFFLLELLCNSMFTIEIALRLIATPNKLKFLKEISNIIDIIAVLPFWTTILLNNASFRSLSKVSSVNQTKRQNNQYGLSVLRILRLTRVLRILKLSRHVRVLHLMGRILYECVYEIILLLTFLAINIVIFSSFMYYIELHALGEMSPFLSKFFMFFNFFFLLLVVAIFGVISRMVYFVLSQFSESRL